jgi:hypothetical protein
MSIHGVTHTPPAFEVPRNAWILVDNLPRLYQF